MSGEASGPARGRIRPTLLLGLLAVLVAVALVGTAVAAAQRVWAQLERATVETRRGAELLLEGRPERARQRLDNAAQRFARADDALRRAPLGWLAAVPGARPNVGAVAALAQTGERTAAAGAALAADVAHLPGGLAAIAPRDGRIPIDKVAALHQPLATAAGALEEAQRRLDEAPERRLLPQIARARGIVDTELAHVRRRVAVAADLTAALPPLLGAETPRRFFFGAQNPAELRGTGGLVGAFAILTASDGRLELGDFVPVQELPNRDVGQVEAPDPSYARRYERFGGTGFWLNLNMTPDFPSAATAIERLYEEVTGQRLDGTVVADPFAFAALLEVTGPTRVPDVGRVDADNVVELLSREAYGQFDAQEERKRVLGDVAGDVLRRFLEQPPRNPMRGLRAVGRAVAGGHLLVHAADDEVQDALVEAGAAGVLDPGGGGDFVAVIGNNAGGNKVDFWAERAVTYAVDLREDGSADAQLSIRLRNEAPVEGFPRYVLGPTSEVAAGESRTYLSVYRRADSTLTGRSVQGRHTAVETTTELDHPVVATALRIPAGQTAGLELSWHLPEAWQREERGGSYRLTVRGQPTIRPTRLSVRVEPPPGTRITSTSPPARLVGGTAIWTAATRSTTAFVIEFRPQ